MVDAASLAKRLKIGKMVYWSYHAPKGWVKKCVDQGPINMSINYVGRKRMEDAAYKLAPIKISGSKDIAEIHFLTGKKFWYQTCFCAYSMIKVSGRELKPVIYDDGTLSEKYCDEIKRIFPNSEIFKYREIEARLDQHLPANKFPVLREKRIIYPHLRKLTDVHGGLRGWRLVLDSDMIFFHKPDFLLEWLASPQDPCHMIDIENSYGYSRELMRSLAQAEIPERLNVGICGIKSDAIDWQELEYWAKTLIEKEKMHYYLEQALTAMMMAKGKRAIAPERDYIVMPERDEVIKPRGILHHYVADSKPWYFRYAWQQVIQ